MLLFQFQWEYASNCYSCYFIWSLDQCFNKIFILHFLNLQYESFKCMQTRIWFKEPDLKWALEIWISSIFDKCPILLQTIWTWNHKSHTKVYFNKFVANTSILNFNLRLWMLLETKNTNPSAHHGTLPLVDLFSFVFWRTLKTPKRHFEINWPLAVWKNPWHLKIYAMNIISLLRTDNCI